MHSRGRRRDAPRLQVMCCPMIKPWSVDESEDFECEKPDMKWVLRILFFSLKTCKRFTDGEGLIRMICDLVMAAVGTTGRDWDPVCDGRNKATQEDFYVCVSFRGMCATTSENSGWSLRTNSVAAGIRHVQLLSPGTHGDIDPGHAVQGPGIWNCFDV